MAERAAGDRDILKPGGSTLRRLLDVLGSFKLAAYLIAILLGWVVVGQLVPQVDYLGPAEAARYREAAPALAASMAALGLDRVFTSWYFLATVALLATSVIVCTLDRATRGEGRVRRPFLTADAVAKRSLRLLDVEVSAPEAAEQARAVFAARHLQVGRREQAGALAVTGSGGRWGFWGSVTFHSALIVIAVGAVIGALTSSRAELTMVEGRTIAVGPSTLEGAVLPRVGVGPSGFSLAMGPPALSYEQERPIDVRVPLSVVEGGARVSGDDVRVNYPLQHRGTSFLLDRMGLAVRVRTSRSGRAVDDVLVTLKDRRADGYGGSYGLPDGTRVRILAVPDMRTPLGVPMTRPLELRDPGAYAQIGATGTAEVTGTVRPVGPIGVGETTTVAGLEVSIEDVRPWASFLVRSVGGRPILYAGFWLAVAALCVRFGDPRRELMVRIVPRGTGTPGASAVALLARSRYGRLGTARAERALARALGLDPNAFADEVRDR